MKRIVWLVMDSFGIGATEDAPEFGDQNSDTLGNIAKACAQGKADMGRSGPLKLPNLAKLGLFHAHKNSTGELAAGVELPAQTIGQYAYAAELSSGKDTPSGHWEMAGVPVLFDWGYFDKKQDSFPAELLDALVEKAGLPGYLGNCHASGTTIIAELGEEHMQSGKPIFYTSADSVFQIAAHEESFGLDRLLSLCELARELLDEYNIGRVIARPFVGTNKDDFERTGNRKDYAVLPPAPTVLDKLANAGGEVISIGKIADIFAHSGITQKYKATGLDPLFDETLKQIAVPADKPSIIYTNFVDFDSSFGHRRDVPGYASALEQFDARLPELFEALSEDDIVIMTADHGCDPTWPGSDHTREHVPVLVYGKKLATKDLGKRDSFADMGQSIADYLALDAMDYGTSFLNQE